MSGLDGLGWPTDPEAEAEALLSRRYTCQVCGGKGRRGNSISERERLPICPVCAKLGYQPTNRTMISDEDNDQECEIAAWELLRDTRNELEKLRGAVRKMRDVKGRYNTQLAFEMLINLLPPEEKKIQSGDPMSLWGIMKD